MGYPFIRLHETAIPEQGDQVIIRDNTDKKLKYASIAKTIGLLGQNTGDILYWENNEYTRLAIGAEKQYLKVLNGKPTWANSLLSETIPQEGQIPRANSSGIYEPTYLDVALKDTYFVDAIFGSDTIGTGSISRPYKTISKLLNVLGQPVDAADYQRRITVYLSPGEYTENLLLPYRAINFKGSGVKITGNVTQEISSGRRWGVSSSTFRAAVSFQGDIDVRDTHNRLRKGLWINGNVRIKIIKRNISTVYGNGTNKIYITVSDNYQINTGLRIKVEGTTYYDALYDITGKISDNQFEATRVSGTNPNTDNAYTGYFYETDSAGSSLVTHDIVFISTYIDGNLIDDDGVVNTDPATGLGVWYFFNSRCNGNIEGRSIYGQRWVYSEFNGTVIVNTLVNLYGNKFNNNITISSLTDSYWTHNTFGTINFTLPSNITIYMDQITRTSWNNVTPSNTPNIVILDAHTHSDIGKVMASSSDTLDYLNNKVDDTTIEVHNNKLRVKNNGITVDKLAENIDASTKNFNAKSIDGKIVNDTVTSTNALWTSQKISDFITQTLNNLDPQQSVKNFFNPTNGLPSNPSVGDRYISSATANNWTVNNIYEYKSTGWIEIVANPGMTTFVEELSLTYIYSNNSWSVWTSTGSHLNLNNLQGGATGQYYHLTQTQHNILTNNQEASSLHHHNNTYYTETEIDNLLSDKVDGSGIANSITYWSDNNTVTANSNIKIVSNKIVTPVIELSSTEGLILKSTNKNWLLTIDDNGNLYTEEV